MLTAMPSKEGAVMDWDVFVCHASEDKQDVVEPLASELIKRGIKVWLDKYVLRIGDSLLQKIDEGLRNSRYGIVILSPSFFQKDWPKKELDGLIQKEIGGKKVVLPVWHNIKRSDIVKYSPTLAGRLAGVTDKGISSLAEELILAMSDGTSVDISNIPPRRNIDVAVKYRRVLITQDLHKYSLIFTISLNAPPSKESFRLRLFWPEFVRISKRERLKGGKSIMKDNIDYVEYLYEHKSKLYPGDTLEVISPNGRTELEYEFDHYIWRMVDDRRVYLFWQVSFDDQMPVEGSVDFKKLNIF